MKKFNVIVATILVGTMLVSCGTTLKKTSEKSGNVTDSVNSVLTMEKTKKPQFEISSGDVYGELNESSGIINDFRDVEVNVTTEPKAEVTVKLYYVWAEGSREIDETNSDDRQSSFVADDKGLISGSFKKMYADSPLVVIIESKAKSKLKSEPAIYFLRY